MKSICLDANILISCVSSDETGSWQDTFLKDMTKGEYLIYVPALINFELAASLNRKKNRNLITDGEYKTALNLFFQLPVLMVWNEELLIKTHELQKKGIRSFYDASYLGVASLKGIPLITEDKELLTKGKKIYTHVHSAEAFLKH